MRVRTVKYFEHKLLAEKKMNNNNIRSKDPVNPEELSNYKLAEFYISQEEKNSQMRLVA